MPPGGDGAGGGGEEEGGGWVSLALSSRGDKHQMKEHQDDILDRKVNKSSVFFPERCFHLFCIQNKNNKM